MDFISDFILNVISSSSDYGGEVRKNLRFNNLRCSYDCLRSQILEYFGVDITPEDYSSFKIVNDLIRFVETNYTHRDHKEMDYPSISSVSDPLELPSVDKNDKGGKESRFVKDYIAGGTSSTIDSLQISKYRTGKNGSTGHGYFAEDYNSMIDSQSGKNIEKVGVNNAKNGPDRIVNGQQIQVKYYKNARASVNALFDKQTGLYKYKIRNGKPQVGEVPYDQYQEGIEILKEKILQGKVPGVKNPNHASKMLKRGALTYDEAKIGAERGTLKGIKYDAEQNAVVILIAGGMSAVLEFNRIKKEGGSTSEALWEAAKIGGKASAITAGITVASTQAARALTPKVIETATKSAVSTAVETAANVGVSKATQTVIEQGVRQGVKGTLTTIAKTNVLTGAITTAVVSVPDIYHAVKGDISESECAERVATNAGGVAGGIAAASASSAGGAVVGGAVGATLGSIIPGAGTAAGAVIGAKIGTVVAGLVGGIAGGIAGNKVVSSVCRLFRKK